MCNIKFDTAPFSCNDNGVILKSQFHFMASFLLKVFEYWWYQQAAENTQGYT
jgi:hypothetical protein